MTDDLFFFWIVCICGCFLCLTGRAQSLFDCFYMTHFHIPGEKLQLCNLFSFSVSNLFCSPFIVHVEICNKQKSLKSLESKLIIYLYST